VVSDKKIFKISANKNTLWTLAAMLDFKSAPKTQIKDFFQLILEKVAQTTGTLELKFQRNEHG
jgi:hypothetical protein